MSAPREGRWTAKPLKRRLRLFDMAWMWAVPMYGISFLDRAFDFLSRGLGQVLAAGWTLTFVFAVLFLPLREAIMRRRSRHDRRLSDGATGLREWAVEIVVEARGKSVGADRGVIWFEGGLMGFTGERTSFLLAYDDFVWPGKHAISWIDVPFSALKLDAPQRKAMVSIRPMWGYARGYRRELRAFLKAKARTEEERQWPPLKPYLRDRLEDAVALQDDVDGRALGVRKLDQR